MQTDYRSTWKASVSHYNGPCLACDGRWTWICAFPWNGTYVFCHGYDSLICEISCKQKFKLAIHIAHVN